jgi:DNA-binding transcriptional MerR regulator/methylmalonyl-CoA mutase cobalamin-binding subunit
MLPERTCGAGTDRLHPAPFCVRNHRVQHPIQVASRRSGLSPHLIRIWERRYCALSPCRSETNRRQYSDEDIERLTRLRELTEKGHRISSIAKLCCADLDELIKKEQEIGETFFRVDATTTLDTPADYVTAGIDSVKAYECDRLKHLLHRARLQFGMRATLLNVVTPLIHAVGHGWQEGEVRISQEHLCTAVIREFLLAPVPGASTSPRAPELIVTTPAGETHELGAMLAACTARDMGWRVTYLGPNLRADEIVACATSRKARAVALSVVYPDSDPDVAFQIRKLRRLLPCHIDVLVGGRAAASYKSELNDLSLHWADSLPSLDSLLATLSGKGATVAV